MSNDPWLKWTSFSEEPDIVLNEAMADQLTDTLFNFGAGSVSAIGSKDDVPVAVYTLSALDDVERLVFTTVHCATGKAASWWGRFSAVDD